jgi:hypothetical protein
MDDRQKTPRGHPNFNSYMKNLCILVFWTDRRTDRQEDREINLEEPIRLPSPHRINFSVCLSVRLSVCPSIWNMKTRRFFYVGIKIRVSTWSVLSIVHPLQTPIPMYKKNIRVQQENSYKITYCLHVFPT